MGIVTVGRLNGYLKKVIDNDANLKDLWVRGEISNFKPHISGHIYLTLKDETSQIKAVMFKGNATRLNFIPANGMKVLVFGKVSVYERDGQYQFYAENMIPDGIGELYAAYEQLKEKLFNLGLFDENHKRPIPRMPQKIGVVTSSTGAAIRDILNILSRRSPMTEVLIYPALVQGVGAAKSITDGLFALDGMGLDVIIIGRGGGSIEDLWAFNDETLAHAIYNAKTPIISAVGHETDFTIADFVADMRAPTPSAAAELATSNMGEILNFISTAKTRMANALVNKTELMNRWFKSVVKDDFYMLPSKCIESMSDKLNMLTDDMTDAYVNTLKDMSAKLNRLYTALWALGPQNVLNRGFAIVTGNKGTIKSTKDVNSGDTINIRLADGTINAEVCE